MTFTQWYFVIAGIVWVAINYHSLYCYGKGKYPIALNTDKSWVIRDVGAMAAISIFISVLWLLIPVVVVGGLPVALGRRTKARQEALVDTEKKVN